MSTPGQLVAAPFAPHHGQFLAALALFWAGVAVGWVLSAWRRRQTLNPVGDLRERHPEERR